jgi:hypothetical protein
MTIRRTRAPISFLCLRLWLRGTMIFSTCVCSTILLLAATIPNFEDRTEAIAAPLFRDQILLNPQEWQDWSPAIPSVRLRRLPVYVFGLSNLPWKDGWSGKTSKWHKKQSK